VKIAVMIMAHTDEAQLRALVDSLKQDFWIFIHIDAKSDIPDNTFEQNKNVWTIKKHTIYWGSPQMVYATVDLLRLAYSWGCDYYMLISGQDMLIKPAKTIVSEIERGPINYLDYDPMPKKDWPMNGGMDRLTLFWRLNSRRAGNSRFNITSLLRRIQQIAGIRRRLFPLKYYGGASWFNISREIAEFIINFIDENPAYLKQFKHTISADEIFFHTLIMNSGLESKVINNDKRYIDWTSGPERPRTMRLEDYDRIMASDDWFARKFDRQADRNIVEKIKYADQCRNRKITEA
jgi:hypothetical protein